jgi:uncharacterized protein YidB (DUF937 family)
MESSDQLLRSAVPGGSIAKPLMLALGALLASGVLFRGSEATAPKPSLPDTKPDAGAGGLLGGLGGLLEKLQQGGHGSVANSWVGTGENKPVTPGQLGSSLGPDIIKTLAERSGLSEEELTKQLSQVLPGVVDKLTPNGRLPTLAELSSSIR